MKVIATGVIVALMATGAMAKGQDKMMRGLDLSPEQKAQVTELRETHRAQMEPIRTQHMNEIRALLTPEQQVKFDKRQAKKAKQMAKQGQAH